MYMIYYVVKRINCPQTSFVYFGDIVDYSHGRKTGNKAETRNRKQIVVTDLRQ